MQTGPVDDASGSGGPSPYAPPVTALAAVPTGPMTAEQLLELPDDGLRHELVEGELRTMSPAGYRHGKIALDLGRRIGNHAAEHGLGDVLSSETGFVLRRDPDTVRAPDVAFVKAERARALSSVTGFAEVAPDLVVEVVSPSDRASEVTAKAVAWLDAGVRLVWVVDPQARLVTVHRPDGVLTLVRGADAVLDGGDVVPGLQVRLADVLGEEAPGPPEG